MPKVRFIIEYNGAGFSGWQTQPGERTVQEELQKAFGVVCGQPVGSIIASGRTDTGVHARGQVITVDLPDGAPTIYKLKHSVSSLLKNEVTLRYGEEVDRDFHPVRDSVRKQYTYTIYHDPGPPVLDYGQVWHIASDLDIDRMRQAARLLIGTHDFTSFRAAGCSSNSPVREIFDSNILYESPYLKYQVQGAGFLKQMVRNIVGTLVEIGKGKDLDMKFILEAKDRRIAGPTAQPYGLCLDWVEYRDGFTSRDFS